MKKIAKGRPVLTWKQERFDGMYRDVPASQCPANALADRFNLLAFGEYAEVRPGTELWSARDLPSLHEDWNFSAGGSPISPLPSFPGSMEFEATKTGTTITRTSGRDFNSGDLYNYFVWPDGYNDLIIEVVDANTVRVSDATARGPATAADTAWIRSKINAWIWHDRSRKVFIHVDNRVFYSDYQLLTWTEVMNVSAASPADEKSTFDVFKDFIHLFTSAGIFQIDTKTDIIEMYRMNSENPDYADFAGEAKGGAYSVCRRYLYTMSRMTGTGVRNRGGQSSRIQKESGPNKLRVTDFNDFQDVYYITQPEPTGGGVVGYRRSAADITNELNDWTALTQASFTIQLYIANASVGTREVSCNFSTAKMWEDIADIITDGLRAAFPEADQAFCRYVDRRFYIFAGPDELDYPMNPGAGTVGTSISGATWLNMVAAALEYTSSGHILGYDGYTTNGPGPGNDKLRLPDDENQWTHYSIWGVETVQVKSDEEPEDVAGSQGVNLDAFVWLADAPVAKAFVINLTDVVQGRAVASEGEFEEGDVGSRININGDIHEIRRYINSTTVDLSHISTYAGPAYTDAVACIGYGNLTRAYQSGNMVYNEGGDSFQASDVGKTIFWADGGYSHIKEYTDSDTVEVWENEDHASQAITWNPVRRTWNDTITDLEIGRRRKSFSLPNRFWTPLLNPRLGTTNNGFMFVGEPAGEEIHYSQAPISYEYLVGHHYLEYQKTPLKDSLQSIQELEDKIILYCTNSTHKILTNSFQEIVTPEVGEVIATITGVVLVDGDIGIRSQSAIRRIEGGAQMVITSEPSVRIFNGYGYSEDLTLDESGLGFINKDLKALQMVYATAYHGLYGFMFWGNADRVNGSVVEFDKCFCYGIKSKHAKGWAELGDGDWIWPEPEIGSLKVYDDDDLPHTLILDAKSGLPYKLSEDGVYTDKSGGAYGGGTEINWYAFMKEHTAEREDMKIKFLENHVFVRPRDESNQGASGYDSNGYRANQQITVKGYKNGQEASYTETEDIPYKGDVAFDRQLEDNRLQISIHGTASELRLVKVLTDYEQLDIRAAPSERIMSERNYQDELGRPVFWQCRDTLKDLATGDIPTGTVFDYVDGPDGLEDTAVEFSATDELTYGETIALEDFTIMFHVSSIVGTTEIMRIGSLVISITGAYEISIDDGANICQYGLNWSGSGWVSVLIKRENDVLTIMQDGSSLAVITLMSEEAVSGVVEFVTGNAKRWFDIRVYDYLISAAAYAYYYENVTQRAGSAVLWLP